MFDNLILLSFGFFAGFLFTVVFGHVWVIRMIEENGERTKTSIRILEAALDVQDIGNPWRPIDKIPDEYKDQRQITVWHKHKPHTAQWDLEWGNWWSTTADAAIEPTHFQRQTFPSTEIPNDLEWETIRCAECNCVNGEAECNWIKTEKDDG